MAARKKEKMESMFGEDLSEQLGLKEYQEFPVLELSQLPKTTHEFFLRQDHNLLCNVRLEPKGTFV